MSLLDDIADAPDDDAARLVWADATGGARGELVVIQCDLARGDLPPDAVAARKRRQRELLAKHGVAWSALAGLARRCTFRRGFVESAEIDADVFVDRGDEIFRAAPVLSALTASGLTGFIDYTFERHGIAHREGPDTLALLRRLFDDPHYARLRGVDIANAGSRTERDSEFQPHGFEALGDDAVELMLARGGFRALRAFGIRGSGVGSRGIRALVDAGALAALERMWIRDHCGTEAVVAILEAGLPRLTALDLSGQFKLAPIVPLIPASVVELRLMGVSEATLDALAASALAPTLERLSLHHGNLARDASAFARFPRLRSLDLQDIRFGVAGASATRRPVFASFVAQPMPALRELSCPSPIEPAEIRAIIEAFGGQLDLLDARGEYKIEAIADELAARIPGELLVGAWEGSDGLLQVGGRTTEPWWDQATIVSTVATP